MNQLSPHVNYFTYCSKAIHLLWIICVIYVLCLVFFMLSRLFIAALWSPAGKGLISWLLFVMFNYVLSLSHLVSSMWVRCGTSLYRFLIFAAFLTFTCCHGV